MPRFPMQFGFSARLAAFYAALFVVIGIQLPFFPLWLKAKGLDAQAIGLVLAVPMVVRIFAIPAAARIADRHDALRGTMLVTLVMASAGFVLVGLVEGFAAIALCVALASAALAPAMPLAETYALTGLGQRGRAYGPVRLWGSGAFILGSLIAGFAADLIPARHLIWLITAAVALSAVAALPLEPLHAEPHLAPSLPRRLLTDRRFLGVIVGASLVQGSHAVYYGFSTLAWTHIGLGGTTIAALWGLGVLAEIVLFALSGRLPAALTPLVLIVIGAGGAVLRWLAMAFDPPVALLPVLQLLHALSFGTTHLGALTYIAKNAPPQRAATAQGHFAVALGVTMAAMMGLSGVLYAAYGSLAYLAMALAGAAGGACAVIAFRARGGAAA
jgi:PPP family 3-phenylpropionic acid transporter